LVGIAGVEGSRAPLVIAGERSRGALWGFHEEYASRKVTALACLNAGKSWNRLAKDARRPRFGRARGEADSSKAVKRRRRRMRQRFWCKAFAAGSE